MRHNAPTGVTPGLQKLDPADLGEALQGALHSAARAADAVHDRSDCRLGHLREKPNDIGSGFPGHRLARRMASPSSS
jgi:hypothetical protein